MDSFRAAVKKAMSGKAPVPVPVPVPGERSHVIVKGDTLWSLAVRYLGNGQKWPEIQKLNGGIDPLKLPIGKILKIPGGKSK